MSKNITDQIKGKLVGKKSSYIFKTLGKHHANDIWNILMIDDSKQDSDLLKAILSAEKDIECYITNYQDPQKAIFDLGQQCMNPPSLIILDLEMPSLSGSKILMDIKDIVALQSIPVAIYSSANNYKNITYANEFGAHAFFSKPLDIALFKQFLRS